MDQGIQAGLPKYNKLLEDGEKHPIEVTGQSVTSVDVLDSQERTSRVHRLLIPNIIHLMALPVALFLPWAIRMDPFG